MDAPCEIQGSIHVFRLVNNMCPGKWVHINSRSSSPFTICIYLAYVRFAICISIILAFTIIFLSLVLIVPR